MTLRCNECKETSRQPQDQLYKKTGYCKACRIKLSMQWSYPNYIFVKKSDLTHTLHDR